jgi:hypothetical protein
LFLPWIGAEVIKILLIANTIAIIAGFVFLTPLWAPKVVFRGLLRTPTFSEAHLKFSLIDFSILFVQLGFVNWLATLYQQLSLNRTWTAVMFCLLNLFSVEIWYLNLRFFEKQQITTNLSRIIYQLLIFPITVAALNVLIMSILFFGGNLWISLVHSMNYGSFYVHDFAFSVSHLMVSTASLLAMRFLYHTIIAVPNTPDRASETTSLKQILH